MKKKNIIVTALTFVMGVLLALPLFAQEKKVHIPDYIPSEHLTTKGILDCFKDNIFLTAAQMEICRNARQVFLQEVESWIKQAEDEGFIEKFEITEFIPEYKELIDYTYDRKNSLESKSSFSTGKIFPILRETRKLALSFFSEEEKKEVKNRRTSSPIDVFKKNINKEERSLFGNLFSHPDLTTPYLKALMKTIRLYAFYIFPLEGYGEDVINDSTKRDLFQEAISLTSPLHELIKIFSGEKIEKQKEFANDTDNQIDYQTLYAAQLQKGNEYLKQINNLEKKYQKFLITKPNKSNDIKFSSNFFD